VLPLGCLGFTHLHVAVVRDKVVRRARDQHVGGRAHYHDLIRRHGVDSQLQRPERSLLIAFLLLADQIVLPRLCFQLDTPPPPPHAFKRVCQHAIDRPSILRGCMLDGIAHEAVSRCPPISLPRLKALPKTSRTTRTVGVVPR
jgi:hypothetical protein